MLFPKEVRGEAQEMAFIAGWGHAKSGTANKVNDRYPKLGDDTLFSARHRRFGLRRAYDAGYLWYSEHPGEEPPNGKDDQ